MPQPQWWNESMETEWEEAKERVLSSWSRVVGVPKIGAPDLAEQAMALGYSARTAFAEEAWEGELENRLRLDWAAMHPHDEGLPDKLGWEQVSATVKHGWELNPLGGWLPPLAPTERRMMKAT